MLPAIRQGSALARTEGTPVNRLAPLFDRLFDDVFAPLSSASWAGLPLSTWEDEDYVHVEMDAPGLTDKDIDISLDSGDLVIRGERKCERKTSGYDTRSYGRFEQRITLPAAVDADKAEAKLANGVLAVSFRKSDEAKPRKIAIKMD